MTSSLPSLPSVESRRFPRTAALAAASEICRELNLVCHRLVIAASLRRRKESVGDIEVLYISKLAPMPQPSQTDFFSSAAAPMRSLADETINAMAGFHNSPDSHISHLPLLIIQRKNVHGSVCWGDKNKLATHIASGIPVDFFRATESNWYNLLVCRTGSAENNIRIAAAAQDKGWKWNPYGPGFTDEEGNTVPVASEQDVFRLVGLPYLEPHER